MPFPHSQYKFGTVFDARSAAVTCFTLGFGPRVGSSPEVCYYCMHDCCMTFLRLSGFVYDLN